jgi:hypothetical protein
MNTNNITSIHLVTVEVLSTIICPVYGDFYSFPWKRGPHDSILEYIEAQKIFESLRLTIFNNLKDFDFVAKSLAIFVKEDENKSVEVKCSILRLFFQFLKSFDNQPGPGGKVEGALDIFLSNPNFKTVISQAAFQSKDSIV